MEPNHRLNCCARRALQVLSSVNYPHAPSMYKHKSLELLLVVVSACERLTLLDFMTKAKEGLHRYLKPSLGNEPEIQYSLVQIISLTSNYTYNSWYNAPDYQSFGYNSRL